MLWRSHCCSRKAKLLLCLWVAAVALSGCGRDRPEVSSSDPDQGASGVALTPATVQVTFDQPMDKDSVQGATSIDPAVPGGTDYAWSNDDKTVAVQYGGPFAANTTYTFAIDGSAKAANGAELGDNYRVKFATAQAPVAAQPPASAQPEGGKVVVEQKQSQQPPPQAAQPSQRTGQPAPQTGQSGQQPSKQASPKQGAQSTGAAAGSGPSLTFTNDIAPLAKARCDQCHSGKMSDYTKVKGYITAGNPAQSLYYTKGTGGAKHPGGDRWKDKASVVKQWIEAGAPK